MNYNLKKIREKTGKTQKEVSDAADIPQSYYSQLERGIKGKTLPLNTAMKLAKALNCKIEDLIID